jgi:hypothetical protein
VIFEPLAISCDTFDSIYIFTDFQCRDYIGCAVMAEYHAMAARRGCSFVPITLTCSKEENLRRLVCPEQSRHGKLADAKLVAHICETTTIYQSLVNPVRLELDFTALDATVAARLLHQHIVRVCVQLNGKPRGKDKQLLM